MTAATSTASTEIDYGTLVLPDRVHGRLYTDPKIFEDELERIWYRTWVYVGHDSEIPEPGDYVVRSIGLQPVVMVRDSDGRVQLFLNRCPHRGNMLCLEERGHSRVLKCSYHGWSFAPDGRCIGVTFPGGYPDEFDKAKFGLSAVPRVDSHQGFVFGSFSPTGPTLTEHLGSAKWYIDRFVELSPEGKVELSAGTVKARYRGNWKMVVENVVDGYHPAFLHRSMLKDTDIEKVAGGDGIDPTVHSVALGRGHGMVDAREQNRRSGLVFQFSGAGNGAEEEWLEALTARYGREAAETAIAERVWPVVIFPNLGLVWQDVRVVYPRAADESVLTHTPAMLKGAPAAVNSERVLQNTAAYGPAGLVGADDVEVYERCQIGYEARAPEWAVIPRGQHREWSDERGWIFGQASDDTALREYWHEYLRVMSESTKDGSP